MLRHGSRHSRVRPDTGLAQEMWSGLTFRSRWTQRPQWRLYACTCFAVILAATPGGRQALSGDVGVADVLDAYESSIEVLCENPVGFRSMADVLYEGAWRYDKLPQQQKTEATVFLDTDGRTDVAVDEKRHYRNGSTFQDRRREILSEPFDLHYHDYGDEPDSELRMYRRPAEGEDRFGPCNVLHEQPLQGYITGNNGLTFLQVLRQSESVVTLRKEMEDVDGHPTYVVEADTQYGEHILWIDPEFGWNPRRIVVRKGGEDLFGSKPVTDLYQLSPGTGALRPAVALELFELTVDGIEIQRVGDAFLPTKARIVTQETFADGQWTRETANCSRSNIEFYPDFEAARAFVMDVPDGTRVVDTRFPAIRYEWRNGQVVAAVDTRLLDAIDNQMDSYKGSRCNRPVAEEGQRADPKPGEDGSPVGVASGGGPRKAPAQAGESWLSSSLVRGIVLGVLLIAVVAWLVVRSRRTAGGGARQAGVSGAERKA